MYIAGEIKDVKKSIAIASAVACLILGASSRAAPGDEADANTQVADLYKLQAAFHRAASGAGVSADAKLQHLVDMLSLWTDGGTLVVGSTTYSTKGEPGTPSCAPGSLTLCDFFANHAGSFQLPRNWTSLAPSFLTTIDVHGNTADLYFECHYFDVSTGVKESDVSYGLRGNPGSGQAKKVNGHWLLLYAIVNFPPLSSS